jgi:hypothetical protein
MSTALLAVVGAGPSAWDDARLVAWRDAFADGATSTLRRLHAAWQGPGLDDAGRATAGVGAVGATIRDDPPRLPARGGFADLVAATGLDLASEAVLAMAWWATTDPQVATVWGCLHDDPTRRAPSLGMLAPVLAEAGVRTPLALDETHPLVRRGLLGAVADAASPVRIPPTTAGLLAGDPPEVPDVAALPRRLAGSAAALTTLVTGGVRVLVRCAVADDRTVLRDTVAARLGLAVAPVPRPEAVAALMLRLGRELPAEVIEPGDVIAPATVLALADPGHPGPGGWEVLDVRGPTREEARETWRDALRRHGVPARGALASALLDHDVSERDVEATTARAVTSAAAHGHGAGLSDVLAALRALPRRDPGGLARPVEPTIRWEDLVLPAATSESLREVLAHARVSGLAHERLGLRGSRGRGVIALFHGPAGTGKTAAAEALAAALDRDLWVVDLARVVSKWLGETQRNLDVVLHEAAAAGAVLLFDEADGLFGKRGEVTDARDRYANLEIDHLLQRIETHEGVVVLTSNRPAALDEAFARRIRLAVRFEPPDHEDRRRLWATYLPGVDTEDVAREELTGGTIRAAALAATVLALDDGTEVTPERLRGAVRREQDKQRRTPVARGAR